MKTSKSLQKQPKKGKNTFFEKVFSIDCWRKPKKTYLCTYKKQNNEQFYSTRERGGPFGQFLKVRRACSSISI